MWTVCAKTEYAKVRGGQLFSAKAPAEHLGSEDRHLVKHTQPEVTTSALKLVECLPSKYQA